MSIPKKDRFPYRTVHMKVKEQNLDDNENPKQFAYSKARLIFLGFSNVNDMVEVYAKPEENTRQLTACDQNGDFYEVLITGNAETGVFVEAIRTREKADAAKKEDLA